MSREKISILDIDWDEITRESSDRDLQYVRMKIDQRLNSRPKRTILIRGAQG